MSFFTTSDPEIAKILKKAEEMRQPQPLPKMDSCPRCGKVGHMSKDCPNSVPTIEEMEDAIEARIAKAVSLAPKTWKDDDLGLYLPSNKGIVSREKSWKDGEFCFNCGEFGHTNEECNQPSFSKIINVFGNTLEQKSNRAVFDRQHLVTDVKSLCERSEEITKPVETQSNKPKEKKSLWS